MDSNGGLRRRCQKRLVHRMVGGIEESIGGWVMHDRIDRRRNAGRVEHEALFQRYGGCGHVQMIAHTRQAIALVPPTTSHHTHDIPTYTNESDPCFRQNG